MSFGSTTNGDLIVVYVSPDTDSPGTISVTDSAGNNYSAASSTLTTGICGVSQEFFYATNIAGGSDTITATTSSVTGMGLTAIEYSGVATTAALDAQAGTSGGCTWSNSATSAPLTTTNADDLVVAGATFLAGLGGPSASAGPGYTLRSTSATQFAAEDENTTSTGNYTGTINFPENTNWIAAAVAFRASSGGGGGLGAPTCGISGDTSNYVPGSSNDSNTNWDEPPVVALGIAVGQSYQDPKFGCYVARLTDGVGHIPDYETSPSVAYTSFNINYPSVSPMNASDSYVLIGSDDGNVRIIDTAGNLVVSETAMSSLPMNTGAFNPVIWDASNGNVFYYTNVSALMQGTIGPSGCAANTPPTCTVTSATLATFSYPEVTFAGHPDISQDGQHLAIVGGSLYTPGVCDGSTDSGCGPESVLTYNIQTQVQGPVYTTSCTAPLIDNNLCVHGVYLTADNNIVIGFETNGCTWPALECGDRLWAGTATDDQLCGAALCPLQDGTNHQDSGFDMNGNSIFIEEGNSSTLSTDQNPCQSGWGLDVRMIYNPAPPPGTPNPLATCMLDVLAPGTESNYEVGYHGNSSQPWAVISYFDSLRSPSPEWFINSGNFAEPSATTCPTSIQGGPCWLTYESEIDLARIDENNCPGASPPNCPAENNTYIYRLARSFSRSNQAGGYDPTTRATMSRDGKYIFFNSNAAHVNNPDGSHGCPAGGHEPDFCSDVYMIKIH